MKKLALILALASFATISKGEELHMAVCCIDYVVRNDSDFQALKRLSTDSPSDANDQSLQYKEARLRAMVQEIVKNLATERHYEWVFVIDQTRNEVVTDHHLDGMLISFSGDDITMEVAARLSK